MTDDVLKELSTTGYGPVTLEDRGEGVYTAMAAGHEVAASLDGPALRFRATVEAPWPSVEGSGQPYDPVANALEELAYYHRTDPVTIEGSPGSPLTITLWIPAADATPAAVAAAVLSTARITTLAHSTLADLGALLAVDAEDRATGAWMEAAGPTEVAETPPPPPPPES